MALGFVALVGGCSSAAAPTTTTVPSSSTSTSTSTSTTIAPTTSTSSTTTSTTRPATPTACVAGQLTLVSYKGSGTAGSSFNPVGIANSSSSPCLINGRPQITLIGGQQGATPSAIPTTVLSTGQAPVFQIAPLPVTVSPGGAASAGFMVQSSDVPSNGEQTCPVVSSMKVKLPDIPSTFKVAENFTACGGPTIFVSAIVRASDLPGIG